MSKNIESKDEAQVVGESELEAVSGGEVDAGDPRKCYFVPENPPQHNGGQDGHVWAVCATRSSSPTGGRCIGCSCWKESNCVNGWHEMQYLTGSIWVPSYYDHNNHTASDKAIRDSSLTPR